MFLLLVTRLPITLWSQCTKTLEATPLIGTGSILQRAAKSSKSLVMDLFLMKLSVEDPQSFHPCCHIVAHARIHILLLSLMIISLIGRRPLMFQKFFFGKIISITQCKCI